MQHFTENLLTGISVTDIIDILVVAYIIYKLLGFIRESRSESIFKGILLLLAVAAISNLLHFHVLSWILRGTLTVGVLALIILFQPELRRALERIGRGNLFRVSTAAIMDKDRANSLVKAFLEATENMAEDRTGALLVFEQETSLEDLCETGTIVDAEVSAQMIENIFYKGSPLHDGALIVRGDKLHAAACVLPLSQNPDLPRNLGTRHRAGIGITEQADCLVLAVSEETGRISLMENGRIRRNVSREQLEATLTDLYTKEIEPSSKRVMHMLRREGRDADA